MAAKLNTKYTRYTMFFGQTYAGGESDPYILGFV